MFYQYFGPCPCRFQFVGLKKIGSRALLLSYVRVDCTKVKFYLIEKRFVKKLALQTLTHFKVMSASPSNVLAPDTVSSDFLPKRWLNGLNMMCSCQGTHETQIL